MTVQYWDPFRQAVSLQNRLNSVRRNEHAQADVEGFSPAVDIYEGATEVVLTVETPGVKPEDLDVQVEKNTLTIRGERKLEDEQKQNNFSRIERRYGKFARRFTLPSTVDTASIRASYDAGVLRLELAKKAEAKPRQIKVSVGSATTAPAAEAQQAA